MINMSMNKEKLNDLIAECVRNYKLKNSIKSLVNEAIKELKDENIACSEMIADLDAEVKKINKEFSVTKDDAGFYNLNGCPLHHVMLNFMYGNVFDVTYTKNRTDRKKILNVSFEDVKSLLKKVLSSKDQDYVKTAHNKCAKNSEVVDGKEESFQKTKEKVEDAVTKKDDLPDAPLKSVDSYKKQSDHSVKGEKQDYTYPKQKDKKLVVKLKSTKSKSKK